MIEFQERYEKIVVPFSKIHGILEELLLLECLKLKEKDDDFWSPGDLQKLCLIVSKLPLDIKIAFLDSVIRNCDQVEGNLADIFDGAEKRDANVIYRLKYIALKDRIEADSLLNCSLCNQDHIMFLANNSNSCHKNHAHTFSDYLLNQKIEEDKIWFSQLAQILQSNEVSAFSPINSEDGDSSLKKDLMCCRDIDLACSLEKYKHQFLRAKLSEKTDLILDLEKSSTSKFLNLDEFLRIKRNPGILIPQYKMKFDDLAETISLLQTHQQYQALDLFILSNLPESMNFLSESFNLERLKRTIQKGAFDYFFMIPNILQIPFYDHLQDLIQAALNHQSPVFLKILEKVAQFYEDEESAIELNDYYFKASLCLKYSANHLKLDSCSFLSDLYSYASKSNLNACLEVGKCLKLSPDDCLKNYLANNIKSIESIELHRLIRIHSNPSFLFDEIIIKNAFHLSSFNYEDILKIIECFSIEHIDWTFKLLLMTVLPIARCSQPVLEEFKFDFSVDSVEKGILMYPNSIGRFSIHALYHHPLMILLLELQEGTEQFTGQILSILKLSFYDLALHVASDVENLSISKLTLILRNISDIDVARKLIHLGIVNSSSDVHEKVKFIDECILLCSKFDDFEEIDEARVQLVNLKKRVELEIDLLSFNLVKYSKLLDCWDDLFSSLLLDLDISSEVFKDLITRMEIKFEMDTSPLREDAIFCLLKGLKQKTLSYPWNLLRPSIATKMNKEVVEYLESILVRIIDICIDMNQEIVARLLNEYIFSDDSRVDPLSKIIACKVLSRLTTNASSSLEKSLEFLMDLECSSFSLSISDFQVIDKTCLLKSLLSDRQSDFKALQTCVSLYFDYSISNPDLVQKIISLLNQHEHSWLFWGFKISSLNYFDGSLEIWRNTLSYFQELSINNPEFKETYEKLSIKSII